jgi:hypothetical protein
MIMGEMIRTAVGVGQEDGDESVGPPRVVDHARPETEGDDAGQCPDILPDGDIGSLVEPLGDAGDDKESEDVEHRLDGVSNGF